ncbi:unnamed protein product, partial [Staurois parvus]
CIADSQKHISSTNKIYTKALVTNIHYIAKSIGTPLQIIGFRCSNHLHGHRHADCFYKHL